jgi:hypothetical protein
VCAVLAAQPFCVTGECIWQGTPVGDAVRSVRHMNGGGGWDDVWLQACLCYGAPHWGGRAAAYVFVQQPGPSRVLTKPVAAVCAVCSVSHNSASSSCGSASRLTSGVPPARSVGKA